MVNTAKAYIVAGRASIAETSGENPAVRCDKNRAQDLQGNRSTSNIYESFPQSAIASKKKLAQKELAETVPNSNLLTLYTQS